MRGWKCSWDPVRQSWSQTHAGVVSGGRWTRGKILSKCCCQIKPQPTSPLVRAGTTLQRRCAQLYFFQHRAPFLHDAPESTLPSVFAPYDVISFFCFTFRAVILQSCCICRSCAWAQLNIGAHLREWPNRRWSNRCRFELKD